MDLEKIRKWKKQKRIGGYFFLAMLVYMVVLYLFLGLFEIHPNPIVISFLTIHTAIEFYLYIPITIGVFGYIGNILRLRSKYDELYMSCVEYRKLGQYGDAMRSIKLSLEIRPKDKYSWSELGFIYNLKGEYYNTIYELEPAVEIKPKFAANWSHLGFAYYKTGEFNRGLELIHKSLELSRKSSNAPFYLAKIHFDMKRYQEAFEACKRSLSINPNFREASKLLEEIQVYIN